MKRAVISNVNFYLCLLNVFLEDTEQQAHNPERAVMFHHSWFLSSTIQLYNSVFYNCLLYFEGNGAKRSIHKGPSLCQK